MKIAVTGKGGAGKTALAAVLARVLARGGWQVLAVDCDTNPGLAVSLGLAAADVTLPDEALAPDPATAYGWGLRPDLTPHEAAQRYGTPAAPGVVFFGPGNFVDFAHGLGERLTACLQVAMGSWEPGWASVCDLDAGPTSVFEGYCRGADLALVLAEATPASLSVARALLGILSHDGTPAAVVVAKARGPGDVTDVEAALGAALAVVPFDPEVARREAAGSLADLPPATTMWTAVQALADSLGARMLASQAP